MSDTEAKINKGKKFKQTRDLVRIALNNGWTQEGIAKRCRAQQSSVSKWKSGDRLAREDILKPLIDEFGHKLRRKSFKVYWNIDRASDDFKPIFYRVEGRIIMDHTFHDLRCNEKTGKIVKKLPGQRLIIHDRGNGSYYLLLLDRLGHKDTEELVECSVPDAKWITQIIKSESMNKEQLIEFIDTKCEELLMDGFRSDARTLPFLIRQALLYAGESLDDVIDFSA